MDYLKSWEKKVFYFALVLMLLDVVLVLLTAAGVILSSKELPGILGMLLISFGVVMFLGATNRRREQLGE